MVLNVAIMLCSPISKFFKSFSWDALFWLSAATVALNYIVLFFLPKEKDVVRRKIYPFLVVKTTNFRFSKIQIFTDNPIDVRFSNNIRSVLRVVSKLLF